MKHVLSIAVLAMVVVFQLSNLHSRVIPLTEVMIEQDRLHRKVIQIGLPDPGEKVIRAIQLASKQAGISPEFWVCLVYSESSFKRNAISRKGYHGLAQIPFPVYYEEANCMIGAAIFLEKLELTKGDYRKAIILYKGFRDDPKRGGALADEVLRLTRKLKESV